MLTEIEVYELQDHDEHIGNGELPVPSVLWLASLYFNRIPNNKDTFEKNDREKFVKCPTLFKLCLYCIRNIIISPRTIVNSRLMDFHNFPSTHYALYKNAVSDKEKRLLLE